MTLIDKIMKEKLPENSVIQTYREEIKACMLRFGLEAWVESPYQETSSVEEFEYWASENVF